MPKNSRNFFFSRNFVNFLLHWLLVVFLNLNERMLVYELNKVLEILSVVGDIACADRVENI